MCWKHIFERCRVCLKYDERRCFIAQNPYDGYNKMKMGYNIAANILLHDNIDAVFASSMNSLSALSPG